MSEFFGFMKELKVTEKQLNQFNVIINAYRKTTKYPKPDNWKKLSNTEIWYWMVGQVIVVGSAGGGKRFWQDSNLRQEIDFDVLLKKRNDKEVKKAIHYVLREAGARYASIEIDKCAKTKALHNNFKIISNYNDGFIGLLNLLHNIRGPNCELERVYYLMENLDFMKNKSARDFLMNMGINETTLAIDIRVQNIFQHLKIGFPPQTDFANKTIYESIEKAIKISVCEPLEIKPLHFDRILYQNYFNILKNDFYQIKLFTSQ